MNYLQSSETENLYHEDIIEQGLDDSVFISSDVEHFSFNVDTVIAL